MKIFVNKLLVLGLITSSIISCHREAVTKITCYHENKSGKDIVVIDTKRPNQEPISISNGATFSASWAVEGGAGGPGPLNYAKNVDVIFNNERIINYDYMDRSVFNNPLYWNNYEKVIVVDKKRYKEYEYYYTFVPEQYDMAEPYDPDEPEPEE